MKRILFVGMAILLSSCSGSSSSEDILPPDMPERGDAVRLQTRVGGEGIVAEVNAGLYMVNHIDGNGENLQANGNYVNNQLLVFAEDMWSSAEPIYWYDANTMADFYAYAPYQSNVEDARAMTFCVQKDQTSTEAVAQSDLLWGALIGQSPTESGFDLLLSHVLSQLTVKVTTDGNFADEINSDDLSVTIGGTKIAAKVDLATGIIIPEGEASQVKCHSHGNLTYTAILIPQQVPFANLIQINWRENTYTLQKTFNLESNHQYTITVKLRKTEGGFDIGIDGWDIIEEDFGGTVG